MLDPSGRLGDIGVAAASFGSELIHSLSDLKVWVAIGLAVLLAGGLTGFGVVVARLIGLLPCGTSRGETLSVGLSTGLITTAACWATVRSMGGSSFTPIAVALGIAALGSFVTRSDARADEPRFLAPRPRGYVIPLAMSALFVAGIGMVYGAIIAPSPRAGVQPLEFFDVAYYSVLGADLAKTGVESIFSPSGFEHLPGLSTQTWYHWGELWLASALISALNLDPIVARHYVVLPIILLASAALTGTLVRRLIGTSSQTAFLFGAAACLVLAPIVLPYPGPYFTKWASGLLFGVTQYGLGSVAALLAIYAVTWRAVPHPTAFQTVGRAAIIASLIPAHVILAVLGIIGAVSAFVIRSAQTGQSRRSDAGGGIRLAATTTAVAAATVAWGFATGHGLGASAVSASVGPFSDVWREVILRTIVGGGVFLLIPVAWWLTRNRRTPEPTVYLAASLIVVAGALAWGARYGDLNMFHAFFGALVTFGLPAAGAAVARLWMAAHANGRSTTAALIFVLSGVQMGLGGQATLTRLATFGPPDYDPIPLSVLQSISRLPAEAKLAYACRPLEEAAFWDPSLVSITAHTGRAMVPMCFQAEFFAWLITGQDSSEDVMNPHFRFAPQRKLYPDSTALPSDAEIVEFLDAHGIEYIYEDADHPNVLLPFAPVIASGGGVRLYEVR